MTNLSIEFCRQVKEARREAGLTQGQLAAEIGCKQSALSMFEQGGVTKLSDETIDKLAKRLGLKVVTVGESEVQTGGEATGFVREPAAEETGRGFCPNPKCPSNHRYAVEDRLFFRPDREAADPVGGRYCAVCGELLERRCTNCGAKVHDGAVCSFCGKPYVVSA